MQGLQDQVSRGRAAMFASVVSLSAQPAADVTINADLRGARASRSAFYARLPTDLEALAIAVQVDV